MLKALEASKLVPKLSLASATEQTVGFPPVVPILVSHYSFMFLDESPSSPEVSSPSEGLHRALD